MVCPICGSYVSDHSRYCTRCGSDVNGRESVDPKRYIVRGIRSAIPKNGGGQAGAPTQYSAPPAGQPRYTQPRRTKKVNAVNSIFVAAVILIGVIIGFNYMNGADSGGMHDFVEEYDCIYNDEYVTVDFSFVGADSNAVVGAESKAVYVDESGREYLRYYAGDYSTEYQVIGTGRVDDFVRETFDESPDDGKNAESVNAFLRGKYYEAISLNSNDYDFLYGEADAAENLVFEYPVDTDVAVCALGRIHGYSRQFVGYIVVVLSQDYDEYLCIAMQQDFAEYSESMLDEVGAKNMIGNLIKYGVSFHGDEQYDDEDYDDEQYDEIDV
jgi:hypothetical protein